MLFALKFILIISFLFLSSWVSAVEPQTVPGASEDLKKDNKDDVKDKSKNEMTKKNDIVTAFLLNPKNPFLPLFPKPEPVVEPEIVETTPVVVVKKPTPTPVVPKKVELITQEALNLSINGIVWGGEKPQAILNGQIVKVGDTFDQMKIESITKQGIGVLYIGPKYKDQKIVLKMD